MSLEDCIFCKLIKDGTLKKNAISSNNDFIAFRDIRPLADSHTLVIPLKHEKWVWDVENFSEYLSFTKEVATKLRKDLQIKKIDMLVSGDDVAHAHIHLLPASEGVWKKAKEHLVQLSEKL